MIYLYNDLRVIGRISILLYDLDDTAPSCLVVHTQVYRSSYTVFYIDVVLISHSFPRNSWISMSLIPKHTATPPPMHIHK